MLTASEANLASEPEGFRISRILIFPIEEPLFSFEFFYPRDVLYHFQCSQIVSFFVQDLEIAYVDLSVTHVDPELRRFFPSLFESFEDFVHDMNAPWGMTELDRSSKNGGSSVEDPVTSREETNSAVFIHKGNIERQRFENSIQFF